MCWKTSVSTQSQALTPAWIPSVLPHTSSGWQKSLGSTDDIERAVPSHAQALDAQGLPFPLFPACSALLALCCSQLTAPWPSSPGQHRSLPEDGAGEAPELNTTPGLPHVPQGCSSPALPCAASTALRFLGTGTRCLGAQGEAKAAPVAFGLPGLSRTGQTERGSFHTSPREDPVWMILRMDSVQLP